MANFYTDNEDLRWYIEHGIDWESLVRTTEADFRNPGGPKSVDEALAFYKETLDMVGGFVADEIAPHAAQLDREGVRHEGGEAVFPERLAGIFAKINELGLHGLCVPRELGGMNAPVMLYFLSSRCSARADVSVMAHHGFHGGMAMAMLLFSVREGTTKIDGDKGTISKTRFADYIGEIVRGEAWGCMDITEPNAGSDMARAAHARRAGRRRQLVRHRAEDLHHLGPRQVPLRHRAHRGGEGPERSVRGPGRPVDVLRDDVRGPARTGASASSPSSASRRSSGTTRR